MKEREQCDMSHSPIAVGRLSLLSMEQTVMSTGKDLDGVRRGSIICHWLFGSIFLMDR